LSLNSNSGNLNAVLSSITAGSIYQLAVIQRPVGNYYFAKGGTQFPNWTLLYQGNIDSGAMTPGIGYMGSNTSTADNIRIPSSTWLPTPLAYDAFETSSSSTDATGPDSQTTPQLTWVGGTKSGGGALSITPSLGSELYDTDAAAFTSGTYSWVAYGADTITNDTNTLKISYVDSTFGANNGQFRDLSDLSSNLTVGLWYAFSADVKVDTGNSVNLIIDDGVVNPAITVPITNTTFSNKPISFRSQSTQNALVRSGGLTTGESIWLDNLSIKPLTLSSLFSTVSTSDSDVIADADVTVTAGTQAGIVTNYNDSTSFRIIYTDGTTIKMDDVVGGTYTNKLSVLHSSATSLNYAAGRTLRVITQGTTMRVYYNNTLVGSEITTLGANTNTKHGLFSTYELNSFDNFTLWARGTGNEYVNLPDTDLTASRDTTVHYSGTSSLKLAAGTSDNGYTQSYTLPNTNNYTLSAFAYTDGSAVTSADVSLENGDVNLATTYTSVGNGWYKISSSFTGVASSRNYGVKVKAGKTVYVDNISLYLSTSDSVSTLAIGNSTTGLGGLSVESTTTLNSGLASLQALIVKGFSGQTANLTEWQDSTGTVLASISPTGGLTSAGNLDINGTTSDVAGALNLSGNALTSSGALSITPLTGNNLNVVLSGAGDFKVNTNDLVVDTSESKVGIGTTTPSAKLDIVSTTEQLRLGYDSNNYWSNTVGITGGLTMQGVGSGGSLTLSPTAGQNIGVNTSAGGLFAVNSNQLTVNSTTGFVGIGTSAPSVLLDISATSGVDAFRLTNSGTKVLGLSYGTNATTFDVVSADPTNKFVNGTFDADLTSWSEVPSYTLNDQFTTDKTSAQLVGTQTSAEPTGGTRTVTDTNSKLSITGGQLSFASDYVQLAGIQYSSQSRVAGKTLIYNIADTTASYGFLNTGFWGTEQVALKFKGGGSKLIQIKDTPAGVDAEISLGSFVSGTNYTAAVIMKSTGAYYFIKGGIYTNWTLLYIYPTGTSAANPKFFINGVSPPTDTYALDNIRIPTSTWLPTPLAYDTFDTEDLQTKTTGPDDQTTPQLTWDKGSDAGEIMKITPSLGSELVTNGDMELDSNWSNVGTPTTNERSTEQVNGGTYSRKVVTDTAYEGILSDTFVPTIGQWGYFTGGAYPNTTASLLVESAGGSVSSSTSHAGGTWSQFHRVGRFIGPFTETIRLRPTAAVGTWYFDEISVKPLILSSLFSSVSTSDNDVIADANITVVEQGVQAGVALNLDSASSPTEGVVAYLTRTNATTGATVTLDKFTTATTWTNVQAATAVTYSAGATLRIIKSGTAYRVYYNNALVGAEKTISDATLIDNTIHGLFSTYSTNSFDNFTLWPRGTGGEFEQITPVNLTATRETTIKYNNSTASVELVATTTDADYIQSVNVGDTQTYNLIAYAYTDGTAVTSSDLSLYYGSTTLTTSYTAMGGTGWYKLSGSLTGEASAKDYGVRVKAGKTVYVDEMKLQVGTGTTQNMYVMNSNTGVTGLNVQGLINGTLNGVATFSKAGTISDADFAGGVTDGMMAIDTTNHRIYFRESGSWSYSAKAGGFQIPNYEAGGLTDGDFLIPYVESHMEDGAVHGLYSKLSDTTLKMITVNELIANKALITGSSEFQGPAIFKTLVEFFDNVVFHKGVALEGQFKFNSDTAGTAVISTNSKQVDVKFTNTYERTPVVSFTMNNVEASDSAFIEEGQKAYLTNVTPLGFSIMLPTLAMRDFAYNWIAINLNQENITKSRTLIPEIAGAATDSATIEATPSATPTIIP
jgi:hypothetical protein